jgi:3'-phosphoadenosine 5'-phosphosulfate sulfotransferase (PAPS reductase)/FAD synthetase
MNIPKDQLLPLEKKVEYSKQLIKQWYEAYEGKVFVSFSGGKDSTALLDLVRSIYPEVPALFIDTGMEYPEITEFVKGVENVVWLKHSSTYKEIVEHYGYPAINKATAYRVEAARNGETDSEPYSEEVERLIGAPFKISNKCCEILKAENLSGYIESTGRRPIVGIMAYESLGRARSLMKYGYNSSRMAVPTSHPIGFWLEEDIIRYILSNRLKYASIYGDFATYGEKRTNCMYCLYGCQSEKEPNKFQRMRLTHPQEYDYAINVLRLGEVMDYLGIKYS